MDALSVFASLLGMAIFVWIALVLGFRSKRVERVPLPVDPLAQEAHRLGVYRSWKDCIEDIAEEKIPLDLVQERVRLFGWPKKPPGPVEPEWKREYQKLVLLGACSQAYMDHLAICHNCRSAVREGWTS